MAFLSEFIRVVGMLTFAVPHAMSKEDFYKGYCIPKDAVILSNPWAVNMDPGIYKDPKFQARALDWMPASAPSCPLRFRQTSLPWSSTQTELNAYRNCSRAMGFRA
ncbi:cytochrome P450 1B [Aspergillus lentulus]|uniref:Cytochrome P450 1B n=1 Tax=Aspergillus lentulus TaxID=293939 RepID=A0ABQ0ZUD9_ASPLE|nr:cytochrome P450 1B [Aspergillus lentulus]GFF33645.1 cytochrome P450 1B [Aspergillus lentulus]GFF64785.1 cytochrome P450 1B [Aspergillus lentulus]